MGFKMFDTVKQKNEFDSLFYDHSGSSLQYKNDVFNVKT